MIDFINDKLLEIFEDFKQNIKNEECICNLKDLNFQGEHLPDYEDILIQQFYLLRYLSGYFAEYVSIYREIIRQNFLIDKFKVLSIGCGCGLDLWGLKHACNERFSENYIKLYNGIDVVDWEYKEKFEKEVNVNYFLKNIKDFEKISYQGYNTIIFPKSIGEFTEDEFEHIKDLMINTDFNSDELVLIGSLRKMRQECDIKRLEEIKNIFTDYHGFEIRKRINSKEMIENERVSYIVPGAQCTDEVIDYLTHLYKYCKSFKKNAKPCDTSCFDLLQKYPICSMSQATYDILYLEREMQ